MFFFIILFSAVWYFQVERIAKYQRSKNDDCFGITRREYKTSSKYNDTTPYNLKGIIFLHLQLYMSTAMCYLYCFDQNATSLFMNVVYSENIETNEPEYKIHNAQDHCTYIVLFTSSYPTIVETSHTPVVTNTVEPKFCFEICLKLQTFNSIVFIRDWYSADLCNVTLHVT